MTEQAATTRTRTRLRRLVPVERVSPASTSPERPPRAVLRAAVWFGMLTGILEVGLVLALKPLHDTTPGFFHLNRHLVWMIPLFHSIVFGTTGVLLGLLCWVRGRCSARRVAFFLGFLSCLSLALTVRSIHPAACAVLAAGFAYRLAPWAERFVLGGGRFVRASLLVLTGVVAAMVALSIGWDRAREHFALAWLGGGRAGEANVLLIVLDTVGAGHTSLHGYHRKTTPNLERIAARGIRFENARSTAPWTLPSHASMFTGRWPHELTAGFDGPLDARTPTLAEYLRDHGYATAGLVANSLYCSAETGLDRGFIHYEDHELTPAAVLHSAALGQRLLEKALAPVPRLLSRARPGPTGSSSASPDRPYKDAARINRDALAWLDAQKDRPFFLFLNYFDAHTPYLLPGTCDHHFGLEPKAKADFAALNGFWIANKRTLSPRDVTLARDAYDDCIGYLDEQVGRLLDELDRRGRLDETLVIITADHGEQFGEHELFGHASSLYRQEVHVPLVILPPRGARSPGSVGAPVSLRNLAATVVDVLGKRGGSPFPGTSLARYWDPHRATAATDEDPVVSEIIAPATNNPNQGRSPVFRGAMASILADGKVYIRNGDGIEELYDLATDPGESKNLASEGSARDELSRMRAILSRTSPPAPKPVATSSKAR